MSETVLVTGATGVVGREVIRELLERGYRVRAAARRPDAIPFADRVQLRRLDYLDPSTFAPALRRVKRVLLVVPHLDPDAAQHLRRFVQRVCRYKLQRVVVLSTMAAEMSETTPLRALEQRLADHDWAEQVILRPNWLMQSFNPGFLLEGIRHAGAIYLPAGDARVSFVDARDIAEIAARTLVEEGHAGAEYRLTGPEALSIDEVAERIAAVTARRISYRPISEQHIRAALRQSGWREGQVDLLCTLFRAMREGFFAPVSPDPPTILEAPPVRFERFAEENAAAWRRPPGAAR